MSDTDRLAPGWYWVRWKYEVEVEPAFYNAATGEWLRAGSATGWQEPAIIGPRLTPPTEKES